MKSIKPIILIIIVFSLGSCSKKTKTEEEIFYEASIDFYEDYHKSSFKDFTQQDLEQFILMNQGLLNVSLEDFKFKTNDVMNILSDSLSFIFLNKKTRLDSLKVKYMSRASQLATNSNFNYYGNQGLAYIWGGKYFDKPVKPVNVRRQINKCKEGLYGLDCSGLVAEALFYAGLPIHKDRHDYANTSYFKILNNYFPALKEYLKCDDCFEINSFVLNNNNLNKLNYGDLLLFHTYEKEDDYKSNETTHIALVINKNKKGVLIVESAGSPNGGCELNIKQGPRFNYLSKNKYQSIGKSSIQVIQFKNI